MDDADLVELKVSPGKLTPKFNKNVTEYSITLASDVPKITFQCMTSDTGASYQIVGSGGSKTIQLTEGEVNVIKIEVTAEDGGTTKFYQINAKRLSAKDASLMGLQLSNGELIPEFEADTVTYTCSVPFTQSNITVKPAAPDKKTLVNVNGGDVAIPVPLNIGETSIDVTVTSADGSNTKVYSVIVSRKRLSRAVRFVDSKLSMKYECPICLGALYCPTSIKGSDPKHTFCLPCINELTRTSKFDPLDESPLELDWKISECGLDKEMSSSLVHSIYAYAGAEEKMKFSELGTHIKESSHKPKDLEENAESCSDCSRKVAKGEMEWHKAKLCTSKNTSRDTKHSVQVRSWEKRLQQVLDESNIDKLVKNSQDQLKAYKENLPRHGQAGSYSEGHSPLDALATASHNIASAIKIKSKQADLHYQLGLILEEQYYASDIDGPLLHSEDLWKQSNVQLLRGCVQLGKLLSTSPQDKYMTAEEILHSGAIIAVNNLCSLVNRGDVYQSMEWVLLDSHSQLLELLMMKKADPNIIAERCQRLSALIRSFTIPHSTQILQLQQKTCQTGVLIQPCNSYCLYLLGNAQLAMYENDPSSDNGKKAAQDAQLSFRAAIALEGKPVRGGEPPQQLSQQEWWMQIKKEEESKKAAEEKAKQKAAPAATKTATGPAGRGAAAARGAPAVRGGRGAPTAARGGAAATRGSATRGGAGARGGAAARGTARGGPAARGGTRGGAAAKPAAGKAAASVKSSASAATKPTEVVEPAKEEEKPKEEVKQAVPSNVPLNKMTYLPRLGLARILVKDDSTDTAEIQMLYNDVITMAPGVHDAYIELGEILVKKDPVQAVDVYAKFPFPEGDSSFDDAYIHGEIVRLLMKAEKYDDPRLEKHMIAWGRVMGIGALEKHVDVLDSKFKTKLLMNVYAGVNKKNVDDSDMQAFFKFKMWL
ncbi:uncharacterized protein LOC100373099 [Saccoglossus kowalevskii]|uniref:Uncharacterized protein LOC100373099 n=1 Tax=Saccoglossus kowalevskii TaxID=10224 RepID=A0ABM0GJT0_SACKO|nr:PREDICTED: uncharacterized protein LOC100373099 [Saccoglossus kowalevskii]